MTDTDGTKMPGAEPVESANEAVAISGDEAAPARAFVPGVLTERVAVLQMRTASIGPADPAFDMKVFSDRMEDDT